MATRHSLSEAVRARVLRVYHLRQKPSRARRPIRNHILLWEVASNPYLRRRLHVKGQSSRYGSIIRFCRDPTSHSCCTIIVHPVRRTLRWTPRAESPRRYLAESVLGKSMSVWAMANAPRLLHEVNTLPDISGEFRPASATSIAYTTTRRKHTGERPFSCHCGRAFSRLDNLRQHVSSCHAEEFVANQRTLASLGEIHTHLSIKALRDQKRAGQVIELGKEPPIKKTVKRTRTKETKKPKKSPVTTEPDSEAGPGPSTQTHRATLHNNFVPSGTAVPPVEYDMPPVGQPYAASPVQVLSASALTHPMPNSEMTQSSVPITRLSPGYAIRHQPFGPYGRPWTAGRPETNVTQGNGHHTRPMTQNSNPDSRPPTANVHHGYVNYMQQPVVGSNHAMPSVYMPEDRPVSSCERVNNGIQRQFVGDVPGMHNSPHEPSSTMRMGINHMDRSDLQESYRIQPSPGYVYNEQPGVHRRVVMNSQVPPQYTRSPYEPVPLRSQIGSVAYDGLASVPPTPQTMQYNSQGRLLPGGSSSNPSYTSSGSMPSRNSRQSGVSSSGQSYIPEHGMQHFRSIGAASSSQVAEIYGNSVGAQESPFSYHPPPTATHPPSAPLGGQFEPVAGQMYYPNPEPVTGDVPYGMPPSMQQHDNHALGQSGAQPDMAHYLMSGRHERRRPSLPIMSLIDADPTQGSAPRVTDSTNGHHPLPQEAVYYTMPYQQAQNQVQGGYSNGMSSTGYSFPNNGLPVSSVYQGAAGPPSVQNGHRPQQHQVGWQQHTSEDPLVGQMDAKARALLGGNGGSFGM